MIRINNPTPFVQGALLKDIKHRVIDSETFDDLVTKVKSTLSIASPRIELQIARTIFFNTSLNSVPLLTEIYDKHLKRVLEAISNLSDIFIAKNKEFIIIEVVKAFDTKRDSEHNSLLRKIIAKLDTIFYYPIIKQEKVSDLLVTSAG